MFLAVFKAKYQAKKVSIELPPRITKFTFYNREAQVLPFYRDHIESGKEILMSGYLKPITDCNPQGCKKLHFLCTKLLSFI